MSAVAARARIGSSVSATTWSWADARDAGLYRITQFWRVADRAPTGTHAEPAGPDAPLTVSHVAPSVMVELADERTEPELPPIAALPISDLIPAITERTGFVMKDLPRLASVSRQTLYNWMDGSQPTAAHEEHLRFIASLCDAFPVSNDRMRAALLMPFQGRALADAVGAGRHPGIIVSQLARNLDALPAPGVVTWDDDLTPLPIADEPTEYVDVRTRKPRASR